MFVSGLRGVQLIALAMLLLGVLAACGSPTPTARPTPTPFPTQTPVPTPTASSIVGPWVRVFDDILVELVVPDEVVKDELVLFQLALNNDGAKARTFYHGPDLAEFVVLKDGVEVMSSHDQLTFGDIQFTNELGAGKTRRFETGFLIGTFDGVLIDGDGKRLPVGDYEVYGVARMGLVEGGEYERFVTPTTSFRIVAGE